MRILGLAIALLLAALVPATAADAPGTYKGPVYKGAPVSAAHDWAGWYLGLQAGHAWGHSVHIDAPSRTDQFTIDGFAGGLTAGRNWQNGMWVFGIEADISWANIDGTTSSSGSFGCGGTDVCETEVEWFGTLRGRIGRAWDSTLVYGTGGLAYGEIFASLGSCSVPTDCGSDTSVGWTIGGGAEFVLNMNWSAKIEYLYVDLDQIYYNRASDWEATADFSIVRGGVNYRW